jgi:ribosomal protein S18 acetylase RimI-like enzyme
MRDGDSWEALTDLLHAAYREHQLAGRNYIACTQTPETTRRRCQGGVTFLAFSGGRLAGTATLKESRRGRALVGQVLLVAVAPDCRSLGTGRKLLATVEKTAREKGCARLVCDTAETATALVKWYLRQGWRKVSLESNESTNYYSIVFEKPLDGRPRSPVSWKYPLNRLLCKSLWRADGSLRPLGLLARKLFRPSQPLSP